MDFELVRQTLESQLKEATRSREFREQIRIHHVADPVDMTQLARERDIAIHNLDRGSALVRRVRSAIERVDDGSYGICLHCDDEIAEKRLKAIPWAELCIRCQEIEDRQAGHGKTGSVINYLAEAA
jgi:RNA polymerase-binding transcription factor